MPGGFTATSTILIDAPRQRVWDVITDPAAAKEFMFGTDLETDWAVDRDGGTHLTLEQDNNADAAAAGHAKGMWDKLLADVKGIAERP